MLYLLKNGGWIDSFEEQRGSDENPVVAVISDDDSRKRVIMDSYGIKPLFDENGEFRDIEVISYPPELSQSFAEAQADVSIEKLNADLQYLAMMSGVEI